MARYTVKLRTPVDIGLALQQARLSRDLSQTELADNVALRQSVVSEIEGGKSTIYLRQLLALAAAAGLELQATWVDEEAE
ncbi:multiprotein-bridging factor 1 family protein [Leucobacter sp. NPDC015123]|uniref:helix-turn-helix domain-containing protein n=1 Tax=Leucobacter sp. NPDC015123 TaxID=3364129 RepID=UPI0036F49924